MEDEERLLSAFELQGWLDSVPIVNGKSDKYTRRKKTGYNSPADYGDLEYIAVLAIDAGLFLRDGSGVFPLTFQEIEKYAALTKTDLLSIEARLIKRCSERYIKGLQEGKDPACLMPVQKMDMQKRREMVLRKLEEL